MAGDLLAGVQAWELAPADITVALTRRADGNDQRGWQKSCW